MRIGLIAMSGMRVCDPELVRVGITLPGFMERDRTIASLPSLGLLTLAGMVPSRHRCEYLEVRDIRELDRLPDRFDLVGISSLSTRSKRPMSWRIVIAIWACRSCWEGCMSRHCPRKLAGTPMRSSSARENRSGPTS